MFQPLLFGDGKDATFANTASVGYLRSDEDKAISGSEDYYVEVYEDYEGVNTQAATGAPQHDSTFRCKKRGCRDKDILHNSLGSPFGGAVEPTGETERVFNKKAMLFRCFSFTLSVTRLRSCHLSRGERQDGLCNCSLTRQPLFMRFPLSFLRLKTSVLS